VVVEPAKAVYKATQAASQNLSNNSSALKESGSAGNAFANFSKGILDTVENTAGGIYNFANDPLGTVKESVNYFREDPLRHNILGSAVGYYKDVAQASYAHDWDTVEYKLGSGLINLAGFAAVGGKTESVVKTKFPNGISLKNIPVPQVVMADTGLGIVPVITTVPVSATISSAVVAGAAGVANAEMAGQVVYSATGGPNQSGGGKSQSGTSLNKNSGAPANGSSSNGSKITGSSTKIDYKKVFFDEYPDLQGKVYVHHGVEQQVLRKPQTKGLFSESEIHSLDNLRGIPNNLNSDLHLSKIRKEWNRFYKEYPNPTKEEILAKRADIDKKYGKLFNPPK